MKKTRIWIFIPKLVFYSCYDIETIFSCKNGVNLDFLSIYLIYVMYSSVLQVFNFIGKRISSRDILKADK